MTTLACNPGINSDDAVAEFARVVGSMFVPVASRCIPASSELAPQKLGGGSDANRPAAVLFSLDACLMGPDGMPGNWGEGL